MEKEDRRRYFIVASVILEVVTPLFRQRLEKEYQKLGIGSLQDFLNRQPILHILFHLRHRNNWCCTDSTNCRYRGSLPLVHHQWDLLYMETPGQFSHNCHCKFSAKAVPLDGLDITLTGLILMNCCSLGPDEQPIKLLRKYKNDYLSHNSKGKIIQTEYDSLWAVLKAQVLHLDPRMVDDLIRIEKRPLDESLWCRYVAELLDMHQKLCEMDSSVKEVYSLTHGMNTTVQGINTCVHTILSHVQRPPKLCDICSTDVSDMSVICKMCLSKSTDTSVQKKTYRLGQDIFTLHHQYNLNSILNVDWIGRIGRIPGGVMMDNGRLVFSLFDQKRLLICNTDESEADSIPLQSNPWDVTVVNNSTVAVSLLRSYYIEMYNIHNKHKLKSIPVSDRCYGITTINNKLVVGCKGRLLMIDYQTGEVVYTVNTDCSLPIRLHTSGDRIFYNDNNSINYNLYCYSDTDDRVTTLKLPTAPCSITSLQDDSLYVVCYDGSVQHVSSDGQHYKPVNIKGLESFKRCFLASYNPKQKKFISLCNDGNVKVFNQI